MNDLEKLLKDYMEKVNDSVKEILLENGISEEETESIMTEIKEELKRYKLVIDIPSAIVSIMCELYQAEGYAKILEEIERKQESNKKKLRLENEDFRIDIDKPTKIDKMRFTYAIIDYLEGKGLLQLFLNIWSTYVITEK